MRKELSIIIVNYKALPFLKKCLNTFGEKLVDIRHEIIIVDNASGRHEVEKLKDFISKTNAKLVLNNKNLGFSYANNIGLKKATGKYILFLNPDTIAGNIDFSEIISWMDKNPEIGAMTCALKNDDGTTQGTGGYFPTLPRVVAWMFFLDDIPILDKYIKSFHPHHPRAFKPNDDFYTNPREIDWITGAFYFVRRDVLGNGFDERYFMYTEDVDLSYKIKKVGYKLFFNPKWNIVHLGGKSSSSEYPIIAEFKGLKIFYKIHMSVYKQTVLKLVLKSGIILRMMIFYIKGDRQLSNVYGKALSKI